MSYHKIQLINSINYINSTVSFQCTGKKNDKQHLYTICTKTGSDTDTGINAASGNATVCPRDWKRDIHMTSLMTTSKNS